MRFLTAREVMKKLSIGRSTVYALFHRADFPSTRIGKKILVSEQALEEWLARGGTQPRG